MIRTLLILLLALLIASPALSQLRLGADGYAFLVKQQTDKDFRTVVVVYKDRESLRAAAIKRGLGANTLSFTISPTRARRWCEVHIVDPYYSYEPEIVGHEFLHCVYGQWHITNR